MTQEIIDSLKQKLDGEVSWDNKTLSEYSKDASLFEVKPSAVVFPKTREDVKKLVRFVTEQKKFGHNISLTGRSAGTDMSGGPLTESLVVEFNKYLNHIGEIGENYGVSEPGAYYRDFEKETLKKGLIFPSYPASRELCGIGGIVNNNSGGEKTLTYGKTEKYILGLKMILRDGEEHTFQPITMPELEKKINENSLEGEIYKKIFRLVQDNYEDLQKAKPKVSKNSTGYYLWNVWDKERGIFDLTKLIVGAQGTFGLLTEATLGLVKPKPHRRMLVIFLNDFKILGKVVQIVLNHEPESFESYDDHTTKIALRVFPDILARLKGNVVKLAWQFLPEFWMTLKGGMPKLILMAEFTSSSGEEAEKSARAAATELTQFNLKTLVTKTNDQSEKYWVVRRESFSLLRKHSKHMRTAPFIDDFAVRPDNLPEFLPKLYAILDEYEKDMTYTVAGHVGDGNFHIIPLIDPGKPGIKQKIKDLGEKVYALVRDYEGSISAEHNDGLIRTPYLQMMYGEKICNLFQETKNIFDPDNIFNPGKKVGGSEEYSLAHMAVHD